MASREYPKFRAHQSAPAHMMGRRLTRTLRGLFNFNKPAISAARRANEAQDAPDFRSTSMREAPPDAFFSFSRANEKKYKKDRFHASFIRKLKH